MLVAIKVEIIVFMKTYNRLFFITSVLSRIQIRALAYSGIESAGKTVTTPTLSLEKA